MSKIEKKDSQGLKMSEEILNVSSLKVNASEREILRGVDLKIGKGETHVLMGPNGAGKSTLGYALMGHPSYEVTSGRIGFMGEDLLDMTPDKRAKAGLFLSFQNPVEVPGVSLLDFLRTAYEQKGERISLLKFRKLVKEKMQILNMDESYLERSLNAGFSGGEKKKAEILQLLVLEPRLAILDETDSGLDVDAVKTVSVGVEHFQKETEGSLLIITHSTRILESLKVDKTHVMVAGKIVDNGGPELVEEINASGFEKYLKE